MFVTSCPFRAKVRLAGGCAGGEAQVARKVDPAPYHDRSDTSLGPHSGCSAIKYTFTTKFNQNYPSENEFWFAFCIIDIFAQTISRNTGEYFIVKLCLSNILPVEFCLNSSKGKQKSSISSKFPKWFIFDIMYKIVSWTRWNPLQGKYTGHEFSLSCCSKFLNFRINHPFHCERK